MQRVRIYTDGGCLKNPGGIGAWAAVLQWGTRNADDTFTVTFQKRIGGAEAETTNNRMELVAAIRALEALKKEGLRVEVFSDSQYLVKGMTEWMTRWIEQEWKGVANDDLWRVLLVLSHKQRVSWTWIRGHNGHPENEVADALVAVLMRRVKAGAPASSVTIEETD